MIKKTFMQLERSRDFWFLLAVSFIFFLLRLPSLFEPYWYGDEGIYQTIATALNNGSVLYRDIWDNKPPLLYSLYALFNGDQFSLRFLSLLFGLFSIIVFFFLAKKLFALNHTLQKLPLYAATGLFAYCFAIPLFEGNIANAENFLLLPILTAGLLIVTYTSKPSKKGLFYAGLLLALAFLIKTVAIFDLISFTLFLLFTPHAFSSKWITKGQQLLPFVYGLVIPIAITMLFFVFHGAFSPFISAVFKENVGYVGFGNTFIIPQGLLYIKLLLLLIVTLFLLIQKNHITRGSFFIYLWLAFSLFNAFFSQRPYTHYILVLLPSVSLLFGLTISSLKTHISLKHTKIPLRFIHASLLICIIFLIWQNFDIYKKNISYYINFYSFITQQKDLNSYQTFFDPDVPQDYAIAQFLRTHTKKNDIVFIWGNPAQVYKMSGTLPPGRFTVAYHITHSKSTMEETVKALEKKTPRFVIVISPQSYPFNLSSYRYVYSIQDASIYERIF
jgi:hypothetical protein